MKVDWIPGAPHTVRHTITYTAPTIRIRMGCGFGAESFNGEPLSQTLWPAGALECIPPAVEHSHTTDVDTDWLSVAFDDIEWEDFIDIGGAKGDLLRCDAGQRYVDYQNLIHCVYGLMPVDPQDAAFSRHALGIEIANYYRSMVAPPSRDRNPGSLNFSTLRRLADFVEDHLHSGIGLEQMANEARLSKFHFTSAFRRATGSTPYQYVVDRRLIRAQKLLRRSRESITNLALECGFSSHAHLSSAFKSKYGISPSVYRRHTASR